MASHTHSLHYRIVSDLHNLLIGMAFLYTKTYIFHKLISIKIVGFLCARLRAAQKNIDARVLQGAEFT